jgi:endonuclease G
MSEALLQRLRRKNAYNQGGDEAVAESRVRNEVHVEGAQKSTSARIDEESIILLKMRPVLAVKDDTTDLTFKEQGDKRLWEKPLTEAKDQLDAAIRACGRIDLVNHSMEWIGTGWVIDDDGILVTNRHVAREFIDRRGERFTFQAGVEAHADFYQEIGGTRSSQLKLTACLHVEDDGGPDIALFRISKDGDKGEKLAPAIRLASTPDAKARIATIGYPAYDSRIPLTAEMDRIFGKTYDKKRVAPGHIKRLDTQRVEHDCTTLGGNSGSVVLDLGTGEALGLHFSGSYLDRNYAVRSDVVRQVLHDVKAGRPRRHSSSSSVRRGGESAPSSPPRSENTMSVTVPVTITVSVGAPGQPYAQPQVQSVVVSGGDDEVEGEEAVAADYKDRQGFEESFLRDHDDEPVEVELPDVLRDSDDILLLDGGGHELKYDHYSVVMSRSRRMCFFSACNIDGNKAKKAARVKWKWDPRIPRAQQIMNECYGNTPKFSRGHMTRREDPGWGDTQRQAKRGNEDSMHVTNTCPQMQAFNSPIWLALEDYALQHAIEDKMKICVFTGPYFDDSDPTMYGVRIPVAFWKVIAFIHDDTGRLCATGYEMDQLQSLPTRAPAEEHVFGQFVSPQLGIATQVPIRSIELRSGIQLGRLVSADPLSNTNESVGGGTRIRLSALEDIRFT